MISLSDKSEPVFVYPVEFIDGVCIGFNKNEFEAETKGLHGKYVFRLSKHSVNRSTKQNRVQWWYFTEIAKETGHTPSQIKGMCQVKFLLREEVNKATGEVIPYILETSKLDTIQHNTFMEEVRIWAKEFFNIELSLPNEFI